MIDIDSVQHGSICIVRPLTNSGRRWLAEHCPNATSWGNGIAVEPRYIDDILIGAHGDGLTIAIDGQAVEPAQ